MTAKPRRPPSAARRLLQAMLPEGEHGASIIGDLDEEFRDLAARTTAARAKRWYWRQTVGLAGRYGASRLGHALESARPRGASARGLLQDVRYSARGLRRTAGTTFAAVATFALGIGAATAVFSVVYTSVLRPLPYPDAARLVVVAETRSDGSLLSVAWPDLVDWRNRVRSFDRISCYRRDTFNLTGTGEPERLVGRMACWNLLDVLGVAPAIGRGFTQGDEEPGAAPVTILGHAFWQRHFGRDPSVIGRAIVLNGRAHTIIGVLDRRFWLIGQTDLLVPLIPAQLSGMEDRGNHMGVYAIGRLAPSSTLAAARAELSTISGAIAAEHQDTNSGVGTRVQPLLEWVVGDVRPTLMALLGAVGFLLLLTCASVANLLLARGAARRHEIAVRAMLGGGRWRLARQALIESLTLAITGAVAGVGVAWWLVRGFVLAAPQGIPRLDHVTLDLPALAFAVGACALAGLAFGVIPAWHAASGASAPSLVRAPRPGGGAPFRTRRALVAVEIGLAVVLLTGAGLMIRTLASLVHLDPGFRAERLLTGWIDLPEHRYPAARRVAFVNDLLARLDATPGVEAPAIAGSSLPLLGSNWQSIFLARDRPVPARADMPSATIVPVSPGFMRVLGMRLVRGRFFSEGREPAPAVVVNARLAREVWPNEDAIGKELRPGWPETPESVSPWRAVVGVVGDVAFDDLAGMRPLVIYVPYADVPDTSLGLVMRTAADPSSIVPAVRQAVAAVDPLLPLYSVKSMDEARQASTSRQRLLAGLLSLFAAAALLVAAVGLAGVVAQGVAERRHEIGVRTALGAPRRQLLWLVMARTLWATASGAALGLAAALTLARWIAGLLYGVSPADPTTLAGVVFLLASVAALAAWLPARRATAVDALTALRVD